MQRHRWWNRSRIAGGLALAVLSLDGCRDQGANEGRVVISEIMYHPVLEDTEEQLHEFVELHNPGSQPVSLAGWTFRAGITFTFAADVSLPGGGYLVVAKDRQRLQALPRYRLAGVPVVGDFGGELDDGGELLALADRTGAIVDLVRYDDRFPWPSGPDALGAGDDWQPPEVGALEDHRYLGRSLERVDPTPGRGDLVMSWLSSPLDGATPGRPPSFQGPPPPIALELRGVAAGRENEAGEIVRPTDEFSVRVRLFAPERVSQPEVEYFVDDIERTDEPRRRVQLAPGPGGLEARLPRQPASSLVRYRIVGAIGGADSVISPRDADIQRWHAYFVTPEIAGRTPAYQVLVSKANWERMWDHIDQGRVLGGLDGCQPNPHWDNRVPGVFVSETGHVHDVSLRYQGSRYNRRNGANIDVKKWPAQVAMPDRPRPFRAISWSIKFPRYDRFEDKRSINLNKLVTSTCQGFNTYVMDTLFERLGIPAMKSKYVRLFVNGAYYHYMQRLEHMDEDVLRRFYGPKATIGHMWKSVGCECNEGPFGWGDQRLLQDWCGFPARERYEWTYKRMTHRDWKGRSADEVRVLIEELHQARAAGLPAVRRYFQDRYDMTLLMNYVVLMNFAAPWDDMFQNYYLYRRPDGKWIILPTDMDRMFGGFVPSDGSFFIGVENNRSNRSNWTSYVKDAFLRAFRDEFIARTRELAQHELSVESLFELVDQATAGYVKEEHMASPAAVGSADICNGPDEFARSIKVFILERHNRIQQGLWD